MSRNEAVSPLRINKTPTASPTKNGMSRPLSEIGSTERRRNSPSFNQATKKPLLAQDASSFDSSPFTNSPRLFWKEQTVSPKTRFGSENENDSESSPSQSLSPKRGSIENLKKASRVKNSSMFAREQKYEYDPTSVQVPNRPLATGRPLSTQVQGNAYGGNGLAGLRQENVGFKHHRRGESLNSPIHSWSPTKSSPSKLNMAASPQGASTPTGRMSPSKSSLVSPSRYDSPDYNADSSVWSEDEGMKHATNHPLRRHAKSVTFSAAPTITEYEMVTPDPSSIASDSREGSYDTDEEEMSFDQDDSFDASLEDTDKTPVVLPEDWRHVSPGAADTSLVDADDDVFDDRELSPLPNARPNSAGQASNARHGSIASDGESRPLPPLPGMGTSDGLHRRDSSAGLSAAAERAGRRRSLPSPPQAAGFSKADLLNMREASMSLEDRLRLMNFDNERDTSTPTQETPDTKTEYGLEVQVTELDDVTDPEITDDTPKTPRISRESILRKVKSRNFDEPRESLTYDVELSPERSYGDLANLDPDVPIPSRECSSNFDEIPQSEADSVYDAYSFADNTEVYTEMSPYHHGEDDEDSVVELDESVIHHEVKEEEIEETEDVSEFSPHPEEQPTSQSTIDTSGPPTPTALKVTPTDEENEDRRKELFASFDDKEMDLSLDPLKSSSETALSPLDTAPKMEAMAEYLQRSETPEADAEEASEVEEPGTPDSVIRHPIADSPSPSDDDASSIPEVEATIKGAGGTLKTRPSLLPGHLDMAAARRQVSGEHPPPLPHRSPNRQSLGADISGIDEEDSQVRLSNKENLRLDFNIGDDSNDLSFGLDREFDNIIEAQKKGYLMRENSKVVVASSRQFSDEQPPTDTKDPNEAAKSASNDPRKTSAERKPAWTTEPWNGKYRRRSIRTTSETRRAAASGPVPPMPGQDSATAAGLSSVNEQGGDDFEDGQERGRVFVKVIGVKDLDLPLPKTERTHFQLTLDNGLHCVTTSWLELGHSAPIGQEFELVVLDDLEFQLTLQTKLEPPALPTVTAAPVKTVTQKKSHSAFRNLLSSPKKRKEQERKLQEEAEREALQQQQQQEALTKRNQQATAWDLLHDLVGPDGSFARAYVCLKNYEDQAYGRPLTVDIPCFNEWAVDDASASSVKSKRGGVVRRPPYRIGKLTVQLLYVPKPKNAKDEDMPKSMNACIRELKEAEEIKAKSWEGVLSQQGGDCPYWRRRFFRLDGTKLTAYHETTRQPRATISLAKAVKLIDDKTNLKQPSSTKSGGRRKSAFAEDEEGYMFVEEGFRIRFANGEVIDFYADNAESKAGWMSVLTDCVGKDVAGNNRGWASMVLDKERRDRARSQVAPPLRQAKPPRESMGNDRPRTQPSQAVQSSPVKSRPSHGRTKSHIPSTAAPPPPVEKDARHKPAPPPAPRTRDAAPAKTNRRDQVRSMIF